MTAGINIHRVRGVAAIALAALAFAGCGPDDTTAGGATPVPASAPARAAAGESAAGTPAQAANAVTVISIDQFTITVPNGRAAALFFFTVGCGECVTGGQALAQARRQAADKADFLLVDLDPGEPRAAIDSFRHATGDPAMPVVVGGAVDLAQRWTVTQLSTAIVLDKAGTVAYRAVDPPVSDLLAAIDKATR